MIYPSQLLGDVADRLGRLSEKLDGAEDRFDAWLREKTGHDWGDVHLGFWRWPFLATEFRDAEYRAETAERAYEKMCALYQQETGKTPPVLLNRVRVEASMEGVRRAMAAFFRQSG